MSVKCLIYCAKSQPALFKDPLDGKYRYGKDTKNDRFSNSLNGKIVASFDCEKVEEVIATKWSVGCCCNYYKFETKDLLKKSCLGWIDLTDYLQDQNGYAIHISNLEIFDEPKELNKYSKRLPNGDFQVLGNAPQNMMNVCEIKYLIEDYVLISIRPEWVAKILNGEKTIEVRRVVVNALKELI